jgi:hypothetical protein
MESLENEFARATRNVTVLDEKRERAIAAHSEVRALLEADTKLREWGIDSILIGSYARQTARYPGKDVDVFLRFMSLSVRHNPEKIYDEVKRVLAAQYGLTDEDPDGRVAPQARSLKIAFPDPEDPTGDNSFAIDAVPAVPWKEHWGIPNRNRDLWDKEDKRWIMTDPVKFAADTNSLATAPWSASVGDRNAYRPCVRLLRQVRQVHLGDQRPGGLFTEVAAYYVWSEGLVTGASWAQLMAATIHHVGRRFEQCVEHGLPDPVLLTPMTPNPEPWQWDSAAQVFSALALQVSEALDAERCRAAKLWRDILGTNERGQVLPLPEGCDADGFPVGPITPVGAVGSNQPRGFASHTPASRS